MMCVCSVKGRLLYARMCAARIRAQYERPLSMHVVYTELRCIFCIRGTKVCRYNWHSAGSLGLAISNAKI